MTELTLLSWNVNGVRGAHRKGFLPWLKEAASDILCLQETKGVINPRRPCGFQNSPSVWSKVG